MFRIIRNSVYAMMIGALVIGAAWLSWPEAPPEGYASTTGLIIR
jgi:hypothetical protein